MVLLKSPMQKKRIDSFIDTLDDFYWQTAESFSINLAKYLEKENIGVEYVVDAYLEMCGKMLTEQIKFARTGNYSCKSWTDANENIYGNDGVMKAYMHGLLLSQFLWKNHYHILRFYLQRALGAENVSRCVEIGVGHGLLISLAAQKFPRSFFKAVDTSPESIEMSKKIISCFAGNETNVEFTTRDILEFSSGEKYDLAIMGEVIEHLDDPRPALAAVRNLVADEGRLFLTTCANCPAIDHVYNFKSVEEIAEMLEASGFKIIEDIALPVEDVPREKWVQTKVGVNYAAILEKA